MPRWIAGPPVDPRSDDPGRVRESPSCEYDLRRGISGPAATPTSRPSRRLSDEELRVGRDLEPAGRGADLLRQLVYLPQASIFVAESQRHVVGRAVLALQPSVRAGGFVGTIDLLVVDPTTMRIRVADALIEVVRSASNKGCTLVEAARPDDEAQPLGSHGVHPGRSADQRTVAAVGTTSRRI